MPIPAVPKESSVGNHQQLLTAFLAAVKTDVATAQADIATLDAHRNALLDYRAKLVVTHDATPAGTAAAVNVGLDRVSGLGYFVSTTSADADNGGSATVVDGAGTTVGGAVDGISLTDSDSPPGVPVYVNAGVLKADLSTLNGGATSVFVRTAHGRLLEVAHSATPATGGDPLLWDDQAAVGLKLVATLTDNGAADVSLFTSTDIAAGHKLTP